MLGKKQEKVKQKKNMWKSLKKILEKIFSNSSGPNPNPGAGYAGALWMDGEFGWTHLAYIGCDGAKYITGAGRDPIEWFQ